LLSAGSAASSVAADSDDFPTTTPIKHVVVIFDENITFDHYFATYPNAANPSGEPEFHAKHDTPSVNGLTGALLTDNPNGTNPARLDRSEAITCSNNHSYTPEQQAVDGGLLDKFALTSCSGTINLNYYDGNTVTALWHYAQRFAMSDNSFDTNFGPSTVGAINLISGQTHAVGTLIAIDDANHDLAGDVLLSAMTIFGDPDPIFDDCGAPDSAGFTPSGGADNHNVGDLLNKKSVTWGWFQGGFAPTSTVNGVAQCDATTVGHPGILGNPADPIHKPIQAYVAHHNPFMYYQHSANPHHLPPTSAAMVGKTDQAMHQYDLSLFFDALDHGRLPAVSFLKAPRALDGHPGSTNSDPLSEQLFIVDTINRLQRSPEWKETAVIIAYDDSDGWYDHVNGPIVNHSNVAGVDVLNGSSCGTPAPGSYLGRCGYGARLPLLVISPWAKRNFVDHTTTDQTSILRFVEDNWQLGRIDDLDHPSGTPAGQGSFDSIAGTLLNLFDFDHGPDLRRFVLDGFTGEVVESDEAEEDDQGR
jgi:phospholipase C